MKRRIISWMLAVSLLLSAMPVPALAAEESQGLCEHHTVHTDCGYAEAAAAAPCGHEHTDACRQLVQACVHQHTEDCYPPAVEGDEPSGEATACTHAGFCSVETGCITQEILCVHTQHDPSCGYVEGREAQPCTYDCQECGESQPAQEEVCGHGNPLNECEACGTEAAAAAEKAARKAKLEADIAALPSHEEVTEMDKAAFDALWTKLEGLYDAIGEFEDEDVVGREKLFALGSYMQELEGMGSYATHSHPVCGKSCACTDSHFSITWKAWDGTTKLYDGNYYLTQDVVLDRTMILDYGYTTRLCLNGHSITCEDTVFDIYSYRSLLITDCVGGGKIQSTNSQRTISNNKHLTIWGGTILNTRSFYGAAIDVYNGTNTYLYGGRLEGTSGISSLPGSKIYVHGGTVHGNNDPAIYSNGDGTSNVGTVTVSGGRITTAFNDAITLYSESFTMTGGYVGGNVSSNKTTISGGTIDGSLSTWDETVSISGGSIKGFSLGGNAAISSGTFTGRCYFHGASTVITGGDFSGCDYLSVAGETQISGGSFNFIDVQNVPLYLSGKPEIDSLRPNYASTVSAKSKDGSASFGGNPITVYMNSYYTTWSDGSVIIKNVASDTVAKKFILDEGETKWKYLERSGSNLVLRSLPHGNCGANGDNLIWILSDDGTLTVTGTGAMANNPFEALGTQRKTIKKVVIESGATTIGERAFEFFDILESVSIPYTVTRIEREAFLSTFALRSLDIPNSVTFIGDYAFQASGLESIDIPDSVTSLGRLAFQNCRSLAWVEMSEQVSTLDTVFYDCNGLTFVYLPAVENLTWSISPTLAAKLTIAAPCGSKAHDLAKASGSGFTSLGHLWEDADCTVPKTCSACGETEGQPLGHTEVIDEAVDPTCTTDGLTEGSHCSVCGKVLAEQIVIPMLGHRFTEMVAEEAYLVSKATCEQEAVYAYSCVCGEKGTATFTYGGLAPHRIENGLCAVCGKLPIDAEVFPDDIFRAYISDTFDDDKDGCLSAAELDGVKEISVNSKGITDLKGVEHFKKLTSLFCQSNQLTTLDIRQNTALKKLYCGGNPISSLDVSANPALTDLSCVNSPLTALDVSGHAELTYLACYNSELTSLDVTGCTALTHLYCDGNALTKLDVSTNTALHTLVCWKNQLTSLDVSKCAELTNLMCSGNQYTITVKGNTFDLAALPGGFDPANASNWMGGSVNGNILTLDSESVTYTYDCGRGFSETFTLKTEHIHSYTEKVTAKDYLASAATCEKKAAYYYSCICGEKGEKVFTSGGLADHKLQNGQCTVCGTVMVSVDKNTFPDPIFRDYVLKNFDKDGDGFLSPAECDAVRSITVNEMRITSLKGVEHFKSLVDLECRGNLLTELDLSANTKLGYVNCIKNQIQVLDVSQSPLLDRLQVSNNRLTKLDIRKASKLQHLNCSSNQLTELDLSNNLNLSYVNCSQNQLQALDVSQHTALTQLRCSDNLLKELDVSQSPLLENLQVNKNQLTSLNLGTAENLQYLYCSNNQLSNLDIHSAGNLQYLECHNNRLTKLDVTGSTQLISLICTNNEIRKLDVRALTALEELHCDDNLLTELDVTENPELHTLYCGANRLPRLDVSANPKLKILNCGCDTLTGLDVTRNPELETLFVTMSQLTELDVTQNTKLVRLACFGNQLTELDLSRNEKLEWLRVDLNQLTQLDISNNKALYFLKCDSNRLKELDIRANIALTTLTCNQNLLTSLDVSQNEKLEWLWVKGNRLTSLDVSGCKGLNNTDFSDNQFTIQTGDGTFNLELLPGSFDVNKASNWVGGSLMGNFLSVLENTVTYTYDCGSGFSETFTLRVKRTEPHGHRAECCGGEYIFTTPLYSDDIPADGILPAGSYYLAEDIALTQGLTIRGNVRLCLNGYTLTGVNTQRVIAVEKDGAMTLYDCAEAPGQITGGQGGVCVSGSLTMYGGSIRGNKLKGPEDDSTPKDQMYGGGVFIAGGGSFKLIGGTIEENRQSTGYASGDGVYVDIGGSFDMSGGGILNNRSDLSGSGVAVAGSFTLSGGEIRGNDSCMEGGGVVVYDPYVSSFASLDSGAEAYGGGVFTMTGGTISGNRASSGGGVSVANGSTFHMTGGTICENTSAFGGGVVCGGTFNLSGGEIRDHADGVMGGGVMLYACGTMNMTGGTISGNRAGDGGGIHSDGTLNISGGRIENNKAENGTGIFLRDGKCTLSGDAVITGNVCDLGGSGGGVYVQNAEDFKGTFIMTGGTISKNDAYHGAGIYTKGSTAISGGSISENIAYDKAGGICADGGTVTISGGSIEKNIAGIGGAGGIYVNGNAMVTMTAGTVQDNSFQENELPFRGGDGGGVYVDGTFTMDGGSITGNQAIFCGGGVFVVRDGVFTMNGGTISGNSAQTGGGVEVDTAVVKGKFIFRGGSITGNSAVSKGGGVLGSMTVSGAPVITGNTVSGTACNYLVDEPYVLTIDGALTTGASIGISSVTAPTETAAVPVTGKNAEDFSAFFFPDVNAYQIQNQDNAVVLAVSSKYPVSPGEDGFAPGQEVEIGGKKYPVDEDGRIWLEEPTSGVITVYESGTSQVLDPDGIAEHQLYPTTMEVWHLVYDPETQTHTMKKVDVLTDIMTYKGTSIRMTGNQGIRIFTAVNEEKRAALIDGSLLADTSLKGYKLVEYGTIFQFGTLNGAPLVYDASRNNRSIAYGSGTDAIFSRQNGEIWFTGMLVNLKLDLCDDELVLRPYMVLQNEAGEQMVIYGGTLQRNIGYVAYQNKDYKPTQDAADFIWNIIQAVYGDKVQG